MYAGTIQPRSADSCQATSNSSKSLSAASWKATRGSCSSSAPINSNRPMDSSFSASTLAFCLHVLHDVGVAGAAVADEVVVLRQNHRRAGGEVQREGGVGLAEVVLLEHQVLGEVGLLSEDQPADAGVDEPELVPGDVDGTDLLEAEVPFRVWVEERPDETAARAVDVQGDVKAALAS